MSDTDLPQTPVSSSRRYAVNFGEKARGVTAVVLPLGSVEAIERLARDLISFGYGMGEAEPRTSEQFKWFEKAEDAKIALMENVRELARNGVPSSVVLAVDPSRSTPAADSAVAVLPLRASAQEGET